MVTVVKIGGSLFPEHVNRLCECFKKSKENNEGIFIPFLVAGDPDYSNNVNHWTAIECMNIIGKLIADKNRNITLIKKLDEIVLVHKTDKIPLLLTYDLLKEEDPLDHSWNVTSDSIACWVAS